MNKISRVLSVFRREEPTESLPVSRLCSPNLTNTTSPFEYQIRGTFKIDGAFRVDWMKDVIKKIALIMAYHLVYNNADWEEICPYIAFSLKTHLIKKRMFSTLKDQRYARGLYCIISLDEMSQLSHIGHQVPALQRSISHRWDLITPQNVPIVISYKAEIFISTYDYELRESKLLSGINSLEFPPEQWIRITSLLHEHFQKTVFSPTEALDVLSKELKGLKKLLGASIHSSSEGVCRPQPISRRFDIPLVLAPSAPTHSNYTESPPPYNRDSDYPRPRPYMVRKIFENRF